MDRYLIRTNCIDCDSNSECFIKRLRKTEDFSYLQKSHLSYNKGETIIKEGTQVSNVLYILDGLVKVYIESPDKNIALKLIKSDDFLGLT